MSYKNSKKVAPAPTKYCKVCHDAGKSESEYRSHFIRETRDPNSKILCPTLLAMECRHCFKKGHTVKYCPTIKKFEKGEIRRAAQPTTAYAAVDPKYKPKNTNVNYKKEKKEYFCVIF